MGETYLQYGRLAFLITALAFSAVFYSQGMLHHDPSFLLLATKQWLQGAVLYRDIMEINPPLIFYLTAPSVLLSELSGFSPAAVFIVFVCALAGLSLVWCWSLLRRASIPLGARYLVIAACFAGLIVAPAYNFGQREHLFIVLALPYFMHMGLTPLHAPMTRFEKIGLGLLAVFGFALKPYFLLPALFVTLTLCWQQRSLRPVFDPANAALALGCAAYVALAAVFHADYFATIVPMALLVYGAVAAGIPDLSYNAAQLVLLIAALATVGGESKRVRNSLAAFSSVLLGLFAVCIVQQKIWDYLILPFESMAIAVSALAVALTPFSLRSRPLQFAVFAAIPAILLANALRDGTYRNPYAEIFAAKLEDITPDWRGKSVLVLTTNVSASFPLINELGARWAGRYPYQWLIAGALSREANLACAGPGNACRDMENILDYARRTNVDDLAAAQPDVVLVDERGRKSYLPGEKFEYLKFFERDVRFTILWQRYRKIDNVLDYDLWVRIPADQAARKGATASE